MWQKNFRRNKSLDWDSSSFETGTVKRRPDDNVNDRTMIPVVSRIPKKDKKTDRKLNPSISKNEDLEGWDVIEVEGKASDSDSGIASPPSPVYGILGYINKDERRISDKHVEVLRLTKTIKVSKCFLYIFSLFFKMRNLILKLKKIFSKMTVLFCKLVNLT